ncbi:MAG: PDZ domain-containing protein [Gammaproteobacteria bacterium]|nr:PDZ domain-containing protein [Gammaproteobacteria bacterium]MDH3578485.1 PDZ domain-containing protein [Gammaproteobacteria bacterium]
MSNHDAGQYKTPLIIFAAVVAVYGIFGWMDVGNYAQGGWNTDGNNTVIEVLPGSPSEAGGLMVGDFIVSLGGIATSDAKAQLQRERPKVGEAWEFIVERDGEMVSLDVTFGEPVAQRKLIAHAGFLVGFCFIGFTIWAYLQKQTASTIALAIAGTLGSLIFIAGPYFATYTLRNLDAALVNILLFLGVASLLNFLLVHFRSKSNRLIYLPGLAAGLFIAYRILAAPEATGALNTFSNIFIGVIVAFYFIAALVTLYRGYSSASPEDRANQGLNLMLIGALIGLLPSLIATVTAIFAPQVVLPGGNFYFLTLVALPITWSMAVLKGTSE